MRNIIKFITIITICLLFVNEASANVDLTIESLTTQNEYFTTGSGAEYLQAELEIGITTDADISYIYMGISSYYSMGLGIPYGGLVEELDWFMSSLMGAVVNGYHYTFPQDYFIPRGTSNETLMYLPILISLDNDEELCIENPNFTDLQGNSLVVNLGNESCISVEELVGFDPNITNSNILTVQVIDSYTGDGIEGAIGEVWAFNNNNWGSDEFNFITNDSGYAFINDFPNGMGSLSLWSEGYFPAYQEFTFSDSGFLSISMEPTGFTGGETDTLVMQFIDSNTGQGIEGVNISLYAPNNTLSTTTTNESGYATVENFPLGLGWMEAYATGYNAIITQFTFSGMGELLFLMESHGDFDGETETLVVQVIDSNTGAGISGAQGTIWSFNSNNSYWDEEIIFSFSTNEDGYATIENYPLGYGFAEIMAEEYLPNYLQFEFTGTEQLTISLSPSDDVGNNFESLVFQFIDSENGEALENVSGYAMNTSNDGMSSVAFDFVSDAFGFASVEFPVGNGVVEAYKEGYQHANLQFEFTGNEIITVEMYNLNQFSASITGTVSYELESNTFLTPFVFAIPADTSLSSHCTSVAVDGTGSYELQLIPGEYIVGSLYFTNPNSDWNENGSEYSNDMGFQLQFFENSLTLESATVIQLNEGEIVENVNFDFISSEFMGFNGQAGNIVMGEVTSDNDTNMEGTHVSVIDLEGNVLSEQTIGQDQSFTITGLGQNEDYTLKASHDEYGMIEKSFSPNSMVHVENVEFNLGALSSDEENLGFPTAFSVNQNFPNPFNPVTTFEYSIPENMVVKVTIYDNMGRLVNNLFNASQKAGTNRIQWNATDNMNQPVPTGMYIYRIQAGNQVETNKMIYLK